LSKETANTKDLQFSVEFKPGEIRKSPEKVASKVLE
jgi:hypothetical protein